MPAEQLQKIAEAQRREQENQGVEQVFTGQEDDVSGNYLQSRQVAHEWNSPAVTGLRNSLAENIATKPEPVKTEEGEPLWPRRPEVEEPGLEEPWIDPTAAFAGGFGGVGAMSLKAGLRIMPSLGRAFLSGLVGGAADYPIGVTTEAIGEEVPGLALPFNVIAGMVSGATFEKAIEQGVTAGLTKIGKQADEIPDLMQEATNQVVRRLQGESEALSKENEGVLSSVVESLNTTLKSEAGFAEIVPPKKPKKIETIPPTTKKKILVAIGAKPETEAKITQLQIENLADLELREKAININLERIDSEDDIKKVIQRVSDIYRSEIQEARRKVRSNVETERAADLIGMTPEQLLARRKGQALNAEEALGSRRILVSSADNVHNLAQKVMSLDATDLDRFEFRKALNLHYAFQAQVSGMTAEAGRALQSFKILATSEEVRTRQIKELLGTLPGDVSIEQMATAIASMDSAEGISKAIPKMLRATTKDMFLEAWINGLLSGPQTHMVNTMSNSLYAVWQVPERYAAALIGRVLPGEQVIKEREALMQAFGLVEGFKDGLKSFARTMVTGTPVDELSKLEVARHRAITAANVRQLPLIKKLAPNMLEEGGTAARAVDLLGEVIRLSGRALMAEDDLFKTVGYRMELDAQALRKGTQEGLAGDALAQRVTEIIRDPEQFAPDIHLAAIDAARYQTFTTPLESRILGALSSSKNPVIKLIAPFIRTPTNIIKGLGERSPLAFLSSRIRADISAGGARRDLALARISMGSMIMAVAATMAAEGYITGGGPSDPKLQANLRRQNWQPYSLKIGGKYIQFNRLEPMGMLFGVAGDFAEITGMAGEEMSPDMENLASAIVASISKNVTSKTWLRGISEAVNAMSDPDRYGNKYIQNYARSLVPSIVAGAERAIDPEVEAVYGIIDALKSRTLGLSADLPKRRDMWGKVITRQIGPESSWVETAYRFISPIYVSEGKESPIDKELTRMKIGLSKPRKVQNILRAPIELTPQEYDDFMVLMNTTPIMGNRNLKDTLDHFVKTPAYKSMTDDQKEDKIRQIVTKARKVGRAKLVEKHPYLADIAMEWRNQLAAVP